MSYQIQIIFSLKQEVREFEEKTHTRTLTHEHSRAVVSYCMHMNFYNGSIHYLILIGDLPNCAHALLSVSNALTLLNTTAPMHNHQTL